MSRLLTYGNAEVPQLTVQAEEEPEMIRSFVMHGGKKPIHALSVGDPSGMQYSLDLRQGDQGHSKVMRVNQEKVNGVFPGICFPFVNGFASVVLHMRWSPDSDGLYLGGTNRCGSLTGRDPFGPGRLTSNRTGGCR